MTPKKYKVITISLMNKNSMHPFDSAVEEILNSKENSNYQFNALVPAPKSEAMILILELK